MGGKLTEKQRRFVEAYMGQAEGVAVEAARLAGYKGSYSVLGQVGAENLKKPKIQAEIEARTEQQDPGGLIWSRKDRQEFWTRVAMGLEEDRGDEPAMKDRLKASELLGKTQLDFVTKIESTTEVKGSLDTQLDFSHLTPEQRLQLFDAINEGDNDGADEE